MYLGKPVIGTKINAIGEIIRPGVNGELIKPKDYKSLSINIKKILKNKSLMEEYGNNSKRLYKENYSEDVFYKKYIKVFESVTS
jgi:glycosyltransferase involved in cell wall biosynthesis